MRKTCLIKPYGYVGDCIFASSIARKLKEEGQFEIVDMVVGFPQAQRLLSFNPYIDNVFCTAEPTPHPLHNAKIDNLGMDYYYSKEFQLKETQKDIPPPLQFQLECGVQNPDTEYEIWVDPEIEKEQEGYINGPYIAVMDIDSWTEKAFDFTVEEYDRGVDVPLKGYGGRLRNINDIVNSLATEFANQYTFVEVGLPRHIKTRDAASRRNQRDIMWDVCLLKGAEYFLGAEGGLANFAAGVGTKTILTADFVHQLYGWQGVVKPCDEPKLGPRFYFPEAGHIDLNPYWNDEQILSEITKILNGEKTAEDYPDTWSRKR